MWDSTFLNKLSMWFVITVNGDITTEIRILIVIFFFSKNWAPLFICKIDVITIQTFTWNWNWLSFFFFLKAASWIKKSDDYKLEWPKMRLPRLHWQRRRQILWMTPLGAIDWKYRVKFERFWASVSVLIFYMWNIVGGHAASWISYFLIDRTGVM